MDAFPHIHMTKYRDANIRLEALDHATNLMLQVRDIVQALGMPDVAEEAMMFIVNHIDIQSRHILETHFEQVFPEAFV